MLPDPRFHHADPVFWAHVKSISQQAHYATRAGIRRHDADDIEHALNQLQLDSSHLFDRNARPTELGQLLIDYFDYRADVLEQQAEPALMYAEEARALYEEMRATLRPTIPPPMNKQKGEKRAPQFFTALVNMVVESIVGRGFDWDPRALTTVTHNRRPVRTLSRRVDGCYPSAINPVAIWEIKEYYYTTTFGSRIADGVYETQLDGLELDELNATEGIHVRHVLMVDAYDTWWNMGKSYLCRMVDMMNIGLVDEVLFGTDVVRRLPDLVHEWVDLERRRR